MSCGNQFAVLVTNQGLVYTFGKLNDEGQLGHGDREPRGIPELILYLKDLGEKLVKVECGFSHCLGLTSLGKVFTWGRGMKGQLGHGSFDSHLSPKMVEFEQKKQKVKVYQIAAGYEHSTCLLDN